LRENKNKEKEVRKRKEGRTRITREGRMREEIRKNE